MSNIYPTTNQVNVNYPDYIEFKAKFTPTGDVSIYPGMESFIGKTITLKHGWWMGESDPLPGEFVYLSTDKDVPVHWIAARDIRRIKVEDDSIA